MEEKKSYEIIDLHEIAKLVWTKKKLFLKVWAVTFVGSVAWIFPQPRTYETSVMLAPEANGEVNGGSLGNIASSFGINIGNMANNDAIYPLLYPDVVSSNDFIVGLLDIPVETIDGAVKTDFLTYLLQYQDISIWSWPVIWIKEALESFKSADERKPIGSAGKLDPYRLSRKEESLVKSLRDGIRCSVDKKTDVITISVSGQDPLVCATVCDSVRARLQNFIISYRTSKARNDVEYYTRMSAETYKDYQDALSAYSKFCDSHRNVILQAMQSQRDELENEIQMKFQTYSVISTQLDAAKAKVQERTPAFTILQNVSVPAKPTGPKRMLFVLGMLILSTMVTIGYVTMRQRGAAVKEPVE